MPTTDSQGMLHQDTLYDLEILLEQKAKIRPLTDAEKRQCERLRGDIRRLGAEPAR